MYTDEVFIPTTYMYTDYVHVHRRDSLQVKIRVVSEVVPELSNSSNHPPTLCLSFCISFSTTYVPLPGLS